MSATIIDKAAAAVERRILREGYGDGAWHGPDLKAALADVTPETAFARPAPGRHNIAEIALHHAYTARNARAKLTGVDAEPFVLPGDDWFDVHDGRTLSWPTVHEVVEREQDALVRAVAAIADGSARSALTDGERFEVVLGITCHAVYHAGQIQLVKRLVA
jgi:DinB family protein